MQTITTEAHVGADGILRIEVPIGMTDMIFDVVIVAQPRTNGNIAQTWEPRKWPPNFFERIFGGWQGEPLERAPQGEYEQRRAFL